MTIIGTSISGKGYTVWADAVKVSCSASKGWGLVVQGFKDDEIIFQAHIAMRRNAAIQKVKAFGAAAGSTEEFFPRGGTKAAFKI